jgi:hypothetical protein
MYVAGGFSAYRHLSQCSKPMIAKVRHLWWISKQAVILLALREWQTWHVQRIYDAERARLGHFD